MAIRIIIEEDSEKQVAFIWPVPAAVAGREERSYMIPSALVTSSIHWEITGSEKVRQHRRHETMC